MKDQSGFHGSHAAPQIHTSFAVLSAALIAFTTAFTWGWRQQLARYVTDEPWFLPSLTLAALIIPATTFTILALEEWHHRRIWIRRVSRQMGIAMRSGNSGLRVRSERKRDPLDQLLSPLLKARPVKKILDIWVEAGLGRRTSRFLLLLLLVAATGFLLGQRIGGPILAVGLACVLPVPLHQWVASRAERERRGLGEQVPAALDSLASGLAAGLSLQQALQHSASELPQPIGCEFDRAAVRYRMGFSWREVFAELGERYSEPGLSLALDGIDLQLQLGGDLIELLDKSAMLARQRLEMEAEVRAVTAQGRLSGWVIAALVPVSAGLLLTTNPRYVDILFQSTTGQILLVSSLVLQLLGWAVISRLIRLEL